MSGKTPIEWTDFSWNVVGGCDLESPGCIHCYAQKLAGTRLHKLPLYAGTTTMTKNGPIFNGTLTHLPLVHPSWTWPVRMRTPKITRRGAGARPMMFVGDMSDVFHAKRDRDIIDRVVRVCLAAHHVDFQWLTKRPAVLLAYMMELKESARWLNFEHPLVPGKLIFDPMVCATFEDCFSNIWIGTSAEDQRRFDERWRILRQVPVRTRFLSIEPQLERIDMCEQLGMWWNQTSETWILNDDVIRPDWVICGGESGSDREFRYSWALSLLNQCRGAGIPFFMKQMGSTAVDDLGFIDIAHGAELKHVKGGKIHEWPERLRVREWPRANAA